MITTEQKNRMRGVLYLESDAGIVDLRDSDKHITYAGAGGFGLPSITNAFWTGENSGRYEGTIAGQREFELPLLFSGKNRHELRMNYEKFASVLMDGTGKKRPAKLVYSENFHTPDWELEVAAAGGLDYAKGVDSDDNSYIKTDVSLITPSAFWKCRTPQVINIIAEMSGIGSGLLSPSSFSELNLFSVRHVVNNVGIFNEGNAPTYPIVRCNGKTQSILLRNGDRTFSWEWSNPVENLVIDFEEGTVTAGDTSYYSGIIESNFWCFDVGVNQITFSTTDGLNNIADASLEFYPRKWVAV